MVRSERSPNLNREGRRVLNEAELRCWAADLGREAVRYAAFVALYGALGSGKSTLVRAACRGAGVVGPIPSPTFTLVNRYRLPDGGFVHHVDLYRIESQEEVWELGWQELLARTGPVFVEWADRAVALLPDDRWDIRLAFAERSDRRTISAQARGDAPRLPA